MLQTKNKIFNLIVLFIIFTFIFVGGAYAEEEPLIVSWNEGFMQIDPTVTTQTSVLSVLRPMIYDSLIIRGSDGQLKPGLAKDWKAVGPKTLEFKLRKDVKFHNGEPFNAEVVKYNMDLNRNRENNKSFIYVDIEQVKIIDDYTVQITTKSPGSFLANLTLGAVVPISYDEEKFANEVAIGTGPFKFIEWKRGEELIVEANKDYWAGTPDINRVIFRPIPEDSTRVSALLAGDVHIIYPVPTQSIKRLKDEEDINVMEIPGIDTPVLSVGGKNEPWQDKKVRKAINMSINREAIVETILEGVAEVPTSVLSPVIFGYNPNLDSIPYDPERAKELLVEAGHENLEVTISVPQGVFNNAREISEVVAGYLQQIGVKAEVETLEGSVAWPKLNSGEFDLFYNGWATMTLDADFGLYRNWHSSQSREGINNPEIDELLEKARLETNQEKREEYYHKIQIITWENPYRLPLYHAKDIWGVREEIENFTPEPGRILDLLEVNFK